MNCTMRLPLAAVLVLALASGAAAEDGARTSANLDARVAEQRAFETAVWGMPAVNYDLMRQEAKKAGIQENQVLYWSKPLDWHNQTLTPNPDTLYFMTFLNTKEGPIVVEIPPASDAGSLNANFVDVWQMPLEDAGLHGFDKGAGAKLLVLPPGYEGKVPDGYTVLRPATYGSYALMRVSLKSHDPADVIKSVAYGLRIKVYPLALAATAPGTRFTDVDGRLFDSTIRYDASFFENLNRVVQEEPWLDRDRAMIDQLRSIGIEKGKPFSPDDATKPALEAGIGQARDWLAARYDAGLPPFWEGSRWTYPAPPDLIEAMQDGYADPNIYPVDSRGLVYSYAYIGIKRLGAGQFYLISIKDKDGESYDGAKSYRLRVPAGVPVEQYWSLTAYDRETHALIRNMDRASRASNNAELAKNEDGSVDIYLGPKAPEGKAANWIPTDPARKFELMFRLYGPKQELFDKTWRLPDVEEVAP